MGITVGVRGKIEVTEASAQHWGGASFFAHYSVGEFEGVRWADCWAAMGGGMMLPIGAARQGGGNQDISVSFGEGVEIVRCRAPFGATMYPSNAKIRFVGSPERPILIRDCE
eukprot:736105-Rhodomonas_salina.1